MKLFIRVGRCIIMPAVCVMAILPVLGGTTEAETRQKKPNVIYILADDLGYGEVGYNEQELIQTHAAVAVSRLLSPDRILVDLACKAPDNVRVVFSDSGLTLAGRMENNSGLVILKPDAGRWDISDHSFFRVDLKNSGPGLVWIRGRLDNPGAEDWMNSTSSEAFILPGETATLGFPFPRANELNDAPDIFDQQSSKPNGHRSHWKIFDPANVVACRLQIQSTSEVLKLEQITVGLAQPYGARANAQLLELPYLDRFGQVRALDWPGKINSEDELLTRHHEDRKKLESDPGPAAFNPYGGWALGPQLKATGFFRTEKQNGRWWLVDPAGKLFFSIGINSVGFGQKTPLSGRTELFEWLPENSENEKNAYFMQENLIRTFGPDWKAPAAERLLKRLRSWGVNTLGAWSDSDLTGHPQMAYTAIVHFGGKWNPLGDGISDPFAPDFRKNLEQRLRSAVNADDPWCLGVFIDNEIHWTHPFVREAFKKDWLAARNACIDKLQEIYPSIRKLNQVWGTEYAAWEAIREVPEKGASAQADRDLTALRAMIAEAYYKTCHDAMRTALPNHLYLGSRMHNTPPEVTAGAVKYVDVLSLNSYEPLSGQKVSAGIDKPCLDSEFHFGAVDRGVPGPGLRPVADQIQRSRAYIAYVTAGLLHPNMVGTHWFAYSDQSAAGRPGENYQIGFVDVTDTPYPEFTAANRNLANHMYAIRAGDRDLLGLLEELWMPGPATLKR